MVDVLDIIFGPAIAEAAFYDGTLVYLTLNDLDNSAAAILSAPEDGIITHVGFGVYAVVGNPPAYNVGVVTISGGFPSSTPYGGSSIESVDYTTSGWTWTSLGTPATANMGDIFAVRIWPGATIPDTSNYIRVFGDNLINLNFPVYARYATSWATLQGPPAIAFKYNTGRIVGYPIIYGGGEYINSESTPDEVGCRFSVPIDMKCSGIRVMIQVDYGADSFYQVVLYDSADNILASSTINSISTYSFGLTDIMLDAEVQLTTGTYYRATIKPLSTNQILPMIADFPSSTERSCSIPESSRWYETTRTNGGSWTDNTASIVWMALIISDITSGTGDTGAGSSEWGYVG
jgi:hypothetical protein